MTKILAFARVNESDFDCALRIKEKLDNTNRCLTNANTYLTGLSEMLCDKPDASFDEMIVTISKLQEKGHV